MKIFLSSTILDLKDLRDALVQGLKADGHEVMASDKGTVPVNPGLHTYKQCLNAVADCDCLVSLIDGRFGGEYPPGSNQSITEAEIEEAWTQQKKTLVFVRQSVWDCKATQNALGKGKKEIPYEAVNNIVEDPRVFNIIDRIRSKPQDNWIFQFNLPTDLLAQIRAQIGSSGNAIDWLDRSRQLLEAQKHLTSNRLLKESNRKIDNDINVGLVERKERPKMKEVEDSAHGSQMYHPVEYIDTKRYEHEAFLAEVVGKPAGGKHIAIIGEPGAGKTTILTKIGAWLILQAEKQPEKPLVVAWISLANLDKQELSDYFYDVWLKSAHPSARPPNNWEDELGKLVEQKRVWLLLDGLDEISKSDSLNWLKEQLAGWGQNLRIVMTCRINQWEASAGGNILTNSFDVYHTQDYSYETTNGTNQVQKFISNWFKDEKKGNEIAEQLYEKLNALGKESIKDLVKNPLRLTLLCESWDKEKQDLPATQADLYQRFVDYLYGWKANVFPEEVKLKEELDLALGELAKLGLNRVAINNDGAVPRFRFTASEIRELWGDRPDTLLTAAYKLGWLNVVGKDPINPVYAFYHTTFQEYFAACSIKHWNYFLPEAEEDLLVTCLDEIKPTFRVFERQWQHVILLWIGRHDVRDNCKNEFVEKLTSFEVMEFYDVQAYCIAATCTSELVDFHKSKDIVAKIVAWAFGYLTEAKEWQQPVEPLESFAKATIPFVHRGHAIELLTYLLLDRDHTDDKPLCNIANILGKIAAGNKDLIDRLFELIEQNNSRNNLLVLSQLLGEILAGNQDEIDRLTELLNQDNLDDDILYAYLQANLAEALGKIAIGNEGAIDSLLKLLSRGNSYNYFHLKIIYTLGAIAIKNEPAIIVLVQILEKDNLHSDITSSISNTLSKIAVGNDWAIDNIVDFLNNGNSDDRISYRLVEILGKIGVGKQAAISALVRTFNKEMLANELSYLALQELGIIAIGNEEVITALIQSLRNENLSSYFQHKILSILSEIAVESQTTINFLGEILKRENINDHLRSNIAFTLFRVNKGNKEAINVLGNILNKDDLDDSLYFYVICILLEIDSHSDPAITSLLKLLKKLDDLPRDLCYKVLCLVKHYDINHQDIVDSLLPFIGVKDLGHDFHSVIANILSKVAVGNQTVIRHLLGLLESEKFKYTSLKILRKIAVGDSNAVDRLVRLLPQDSVDDEFRTHVAIALEKIVKKETMPSVILNLKNYVTEEACESNFSLFQDCYKILFYCAQTVSYLEFYDLWHQKTNILSEHS
jgi:Domain of unknown function (DUF4062)/NACHT domain